MTKRNRQITSVSLPPDLVAALDAWRDRQPARPSRSALFELALREWLATTTRKKS